MKRRYKALIAILVPIIIVTLLNYFHPLSYNILMGYMVAVVLVFKSSLLSLWLVSKLKILSFIKSLTLIQAIMLGIKRWFIDNLVSQWLEKYIFRYLKKPFQEVFLYYKSVSLKAKLKNFFVVFLPLSVAIWVMYLLDVLTHFALFVELKMLVIGFFKALWVILGKVFSIVPAIFAWLSGSWLAPIVEVFALSYLLTLIERLLGSNNPLTRFFNYIGDKLNDFLEYIGLLNDKHIEPILNNTISKGTQTLGQKISSMIKAKKIREEHLYFDNFQNIILRGHINAYHNFKGMEDIKDKKRLYSLINEKTRDNIDILAYVSRNGKGELLEEPTDNNYYHDIFLLKGIASNRTYGIKEHLENEIDYTDFWVLNTSQFPVWIKSYSENIEDTLLNGHEMKFIKTKSHVHFKQYDLYFEYKQIEVHPTQL
ncbi:MAG: hypothetical protein K0U38_09075 [Epsilonproteobacteria bacterium]|nr:hypothetical protein [Campylobacterota bacterium]